MLYSPEIVMLPRPPAKFLPISARMRWSGASPLDAAGLDRVAASIGPQGPALIANYRAIEPSYDPTHLASRAMTSRFIAGTYTLADRKAEQGGAPVYVYRLAYETSVNGGVLKTPHTLDLPSCSITWICRVC